MNSSKERTEKYQPHLFPDPKPPNRSPFADPDVQQIFIVQ